MSNPPPVPSAPKRSQQQRILDLTRERDRISTECLALKELFGRVREAVFNGADAPELKSLLVDHWQLTKPPARVFDLIRHVDVSGVSGPGRVAEGIEFESGRVALCWLTESGSVGIYDSLEHVVKIHGHGGSTEVVFRNTQEAKK